MAARGRKLRETCLQAGLQRSLTSLYLTKPSSPHPKQHLPSITRLCGVWVCFPSWAEHVSSPRAHTPKHRRERETCLFGCIWFHRFAATLKRVFSLKQHLVAEELLFNAIEHKIVAGLQNHISSSPGLPWHHWKDGPALDHLGFGQNKLSEREIVPEQLNLAILIIPGGSCSVN